MTRSRSPLGGAGGAPGRPHRSRAARQLLRAVPPERPLRRICQRQCGHQRRRRSDFLSARAQGLCGFGHRGAFATAFLSTRRDRASPAERPRRRPSRGFRRTGRIVGVGGRRRTGAARDGAPAVGRPEALPVRLSGHRRHTVAARCPVRTERRGMAERLPRRRALPGAAPGRADSARWGGERRTAEKDDPAPPGPFRIADRQCRRLCRGGGAPAGRGRKAGEGPADGHAGRRPARPLDITRITPDLLPPPRNGPRSSDDCSPGSIRYRRPRSSTRRRSASPARWSVSVKTAVAFARRSWPTPPSRPRSSCNTRRISARPRAPRSR